MFAKLKSRQFALLVLAMVLGHVALANTPRNCTGFLLVLLAFELGALIYLIRGWGYKIKWSHFALIVILLRLPYVFVEPLLSDDFFRFWWDGLVQTLWYSPYAYLPIDLVNSLPNDIPWFKQINSPEYYSVYPPLLQVLFRGVYMLCPEHFVFALKGFVVGFELIIALLLWKQRSYFPKGGRGLMLYFMFPVLILEGLGNLHFEVLMLPLFLLAYAYWKEGVKPGFLSGVLMALAVGVKLSVLPFVLLFVGGNKVRLFHFLMGFSLAIIIPSLPFSFLDLRHAYQSIELYFGVFEFNNLIYYAIRELSQNMVGYNPIAQYGLFYKAFLMVLAAFVLLRYGNKGEKEKLWALSCFYAVYFLFNPVIHPWYLLVPLVFVLFNSAYLWIAALCLSPWSYFFYHSGAQVGWWLFVEWGIFLCISLLLCYRDNPLLGIKKPSA